jgi:thiol-disulfide isomerase/thioredoxin
MMRGLHPRAVVIGCALLLAAALAQPAAVALGAEPASPQQQAEVKEQLDRAQQALGRNDFKSALEAFKRADHLAGGHSVEACAGLAAIDSRAGLYPDGIKTARRGLEMATTPGDQSRFANWLGLSLYQKSKSQQDKKALDEAIVSFRQALELSGGRSNAVRFNLGIALLARSQDEEGVAVLRAFLEAQPEGADTTQAKRFIADPRRARDAFAPDFSLLTLDAKSISLEDLKGRAVLIDFWATWCEPCRESAPFLKQLAEKMKQQPFVLLGVSADRDEAKLRTFLSHEAAGETWPQYWDQGGKMARMFQVNAFPTFIVLDGDGRIVLTTQGWNSKREHDVQSAVSHTIDQLAAATPPPATKP